MASPLLDCAPPSELARRGQVIELKGQIEDFDRLTAAIVSELSVLPEAEWPRKWRRSPVDIRLRYGWSSVQPGIPELQGRVATAIPAVCQRCLRPFELEVEVELKLLLPAPGTDVEAIDGYEVWEPDDSDARPLDIVDEALVMGMPFVSMHPSRDDCSTSDGSIPVDKGELQRPFADLKSLLGDAEREK